MGCKVKKDRYIGRGQDGLAKEVRRLSRRRIAFRDKFVPDYATRRWKSRQRLADEDRFVPNAETRRWKSR